MSKVEGSKKEVLEKIQKFKKKRGGSPKVEKWHFGPFLRRVTFWW
jgi:hypothetical protein